MPNPDGDRLFCKKGEVYYSWKFKHSPTIFSTKYPSARDLTRNDWELFRLDLDDMLDAEDCDDWMEEIRTFLEEKLGELEEKQSNMSEYGGLSNTPSYELLQERIDYINEKLEELDED